MVCMYRSFNLCITANIAFVVITKVMIGKISFHVITSGCRMPLVRFVMFPYLRN